MKVNLTVQVGECAVVHELNNVQQSEYIELIHLAKSSNKNMVSFTWDGGLSEITFIPSDAKVVYATRSQP